MSSLRRAPAWALWAGGGAVCFLAGDLASSGGFLMLVLGCVCFLVSWLIFWSEREKNGEIPEKKRRFARSIKRITFAALILGLVLLAGTEAVILSAAGGTGGGDAKTVIVLGAGLRGDEPSLILRSRLETALDYLEAHPEARVVVCGGQGPDEDWPEAWVMAKWLTQNGVAEGRIFQEDRSHNTRENLENARIILETEGLEGPLLLVSSRSHLFRARRLAGQLGMKTETLGAPTPQVWLIPSVYLREACSVWLMLAREIL